MTPLSPEQFYSARVIEIVREAFTRAMRDQGICPRDRFTISARAALNIQEALEHDAKGD